MNFKPRLASAAVLTLLSLPVAAQIHLRAPVVGDLCTAPNATVVNPFTSSSTTVGATNNYDIATTCGVTQTLFAGTGASLDVAYGVVTDANCSVTVSADPTGTNWDLAMYVLQAPNAACTQLPTLADPQCITMDDDGASNTTETVTFNAIAGTEYYVIIDGFNAATGTFDLTVTGTGCNLVGAGAIADVGITKTDNQTTATAGSPITYTIVASNSGPGAAPIVTVADTFPATLTGATWTCVGAGGGTCTASGSGNINDSAALPSGGSVTYTVNATISAAATGTLSNTATATVGAGATDNNPANNTATDTSTLGAPTADLSITKTDGVTTATPGGSVTYTITASNAGPNAAPGATVADTFPAALTCTWTCVGAGGGTCTASGSGNINDTVNLPSGGSVTHTASCTISAAATGTLSNTATVTAPAGVTDPTPGNNSATDTDTLGASADLSITKTDGVTTATPGGSVTYTITASNAGPSAATGATVADTFPAALTCTWTCVGAGGGTCTASGSGNINGTVNLPSGGSVTYTAACTISAAATGSLVNTATVTAPAGVTDPTPGNNSATDTDALGASADLSITKTDGVTTATAGTSVTYTIVASNAGPSTATGATVADVFPATETCTWTCAGAAGGTCTGAGSGNISDTVNLPSGASVSYSAVCAISVAATGSVSNTATVTAPAGVTDAVPGNNSATDTDTISAAPAANVSGTKIASGSFVAGSNVTYTIVLTNAGPGVQGDNPGDEFVDTLPAGLTLISATSSSGTTTSAAGVVRWNGSLAANGSVTITIVARINPGVTGTISNQGSIAYDGDGNGTNEASRLTDDPGVAGAANPTGFVAVGVVSIPLPMLDRLGLIGLLMGMACIVLLRRK